jgi:RecA/RadA recombinase
MRRTKETKPKEETSSSDEQLVQRYGADPARLKAMAGLTAKLKGFKPAKEVLTKVRALPTIFPLYDRATKVGGHPLERFALVHGPSNHGKTAFVHGLGLSFLRTGNFYFYVDAEYTSPETWLDTLMHQYSDHPGFVAQRPESYDETVESVRQSLLTIAKARDDGDLPPDATALVVVDSIQKLMPKNLMSKIVKDSNKNGFDGASGRGAMIKAALNAQWLNELTPLLYHTKATMVMISREYQTGEDLSKLHEPGGGSEYVVGGGKSLVFESSLVVRVTRRFVEEGSGENKKIVGERHQLQITKTKVSGKQAKSEYGYFHTSNGVLVPAGFDRARDVLELAIGAGKVEQNNAWYSCPVLGKKWNGISKAVVELTNDPFLLDTLEGESRGTSEV